MSLTNLPVIGGDGADYTVPINSDPSTGTAQAAANTLLAALATHSDAQSILTALGLLATAAKQPNLNGDGGSLSHITNFPANQAVQATGLGFSPSGVAAVAGTFVATGSSAAFTPLAGRPFNIAIWGAATTPGSTLGGTVYLARSCDGGTNLSAHHRQW